ncbi:MAG TPA: hypothetical protein VM888_04330 [Chitinophagaceae bacterium]|nr:hypothetical protein [Chitinophagaceae bacterium]
MQREQNNNMEDRDTMNTGRTLDRTDDQTSTLNDTDGILETPVSRMDGQTLFGNVSDTYIAPGGDDGDEDYDDEDDDDDLDDVDDVDDDLDTAAIDTDAADVDPDAEDLNDDDLLLDDDDDEDDDDDTL